MKQAKSTRLILIAAMGKERQIGLHGKLPWSIPSEYAHYENTVRGHYLIMGRKNFEAHKKDVQIGIPLVLSRRESADTFTSPEEIIKFLENKKVDKAYVIGGEEIYRVFMPFAHEILLSEVDYNGPADTYFPEIDQNDWQLKKKETFEDYALNHWIKRS